MARMKKFFTALLPVQVSKYVPEMNAITQYQSGREEIAQTMTLYFVKLPIALWNSYIYIPKIHQTRNGGSVDSYDAKKENQIICIIIDSMEALR